MPMPKRCRACGSKNVSRSSRHNILEKLISFFKVLPYRCLDCNARFFGGTRKG